MQDRSALLKLAAVAGSAGLWAAGRSMGLDGPALSGVMGAVGSFGTQAALALSSEFFGQIFNSTIDDVSERAADRVRSQQNHDIHRLIGEVIATFFDRAARECRQRGAKKYLRDAAASFRSDAWMTLTLSPEQSPIAERSIANYFKQPPESAKQPVLDPAEWRGVFVTVAGPPPRSVADDVLDPIIAALNAQFATALWESMKKAWKDQDLAWPALLLRLLTLILAEAGRASTATAGLSAKLDALSAKIDALTTVASRAPAERPADSARPGRRRGATRDAAQSQDLRDALGEYESDLRARIDAIRTTIKETEQRLLRAIVGAPQWTTWDAYAEHLIKHEFANVKTWYEPVDLAPEVFRPSGLDDPFRFDPRSTGEGAADDGASIEEIARRVPRMVLVGEPGAGKTSALKYLVRQTADRMLKGQAPPPPIYATLSDWSELLKRNPAGDLYDLLAGGIRHHSKLAIEPAALAALLEAGPATLIFDGLDEVRRVDGRRAFATALTQFCAQSTQEHVVIIGSRKYGFTDDLRAELRDFEVFEPVRLDDEKKLRIIRRYVKTSRPEVVLSAINESYRVARLSDNALLLRLLAEQFDGSQGTLQRTRGMAIERHADTAIGRVTSIAVDPGKAACAKDLLSRFAELMREHHDRRLSEADTLAAITDRMAADTGMPRLELITALVETRLIDRFEDRTIQFALPAFEDYFRARSAAAKLRNTVHAPEQLRRLDLFRDRDLHDVLVVAAGLLRPEEVAIVIDSLDDQSDMWLKARILGEADAENPERDFGERLESHVRTALKKALTGISRTWLTILVAWWTGILPIAFAVESLVQAGRDMWAWGLSVGYLLLVPFLLGRLHRLLLTLYTSNLELLVPKVMRAFSCLRTTSTRMRLMTLRDLVYEQRPDWQYAEDDDVFVSLLDRIEQHMDDAVRLAERDIDSLMDEVESDPRLIGQFLSLPAAQFRTDEVVLFGRFVQSVEAAATTKIKCVEKLIEVARVSVALRKDIAEVLSEIVRDVSVDQSVRQLAHDGVHAIKNVQPGSAPAREFSLVQGAVTLGFVAGAIAIGIVLSSPTPMSVFAASAASAVLATMACLVVRRSRPELSRTARRFAIVWLLVLAPSLGIAYWVGVTLLPEPPVESRSTRL